ncbi:hypothetical protein EJ05DRAFT_441229 [Pseudovirgaria hyperparasitica]|uniref:Cation efflux protein transmembrane domain-containing protein n=1 Tax=Pseudovirgaria hyperparasitica TaxID=470096 RepID=A0A6A6W1N7_9PEZI|nr:uncharacterized protein EJ05DRAFT_441229 [Pseudovirgaria hyperparasitica]KAF2756455.1 hypothetical protein EJ05DRAFT_441229 [Pseudovirgaria hyperparasitica]
MATSTITQIRHHVGHSHHHHHHDNTYLLSQNKNDAGVKITRIGLYVNFGMAIGKGVGGYFFNSQGTLTDLISDFMTLATISWSLKPPSTRFPGGYGKFESLGSLGVSGLLVGGGLMMGWAALAAICQQFFPDFADLASNLGIMGHGHSHHHGVEELGPNINAIWLAAGSIVIKEWLYRATLKVANERKSSVLASNAYHHRVDSLTAFVALLMIGGSNFLTNASWLDPVGGLVISLMVVQAGYGNTKAALLELADVGVEEEMVNNVRGRATQALESIGESSVGVRNVEGVKSGQNYLMDIELAVPESWTITKTREVETIVRERIGEKIKGVKRLRVRFVADNTDPNVFDEFINFDPRSRELQADHDHDHDHDHNHPHSNGAPQSISKRQ